MCCKDVDVAIVAKADGVVVSGLATKYCFPLVCASSFSVNLEESVVGDLVVGHITLDFELHAEVIFVHNTAAVIEFTLSYSTLVLPCLDYEVLKEACKYADKIRIIHTHLREGDIVYSYENSNMTVIKNTCHVAGLSFLRLFVDP